MIYYRISVRYFKDINMININFLMLKITEVQAEQFFDDYIIEKQRKQMCNVKLNIV